MPDSQRYPWNLFLLYNVEEIGFFLCVKVFISRTPILASCRKSLLKIIKFKIIWLILGSDKVVQSTGVNRTLPALHEGSHKITRTVPLIFQGSQFRFSLWWGWEDYAPNWRIFRRQWFTIIPRVSGFQFSPTIPSSA